MRTNTIERDGITYVHQQNAARHTVHETTGSLMVMNIISKKMAPVEGGIIGEPRGDKPGKNMVGIWVPKTP